MVFNEALKAAGLDVIVCLNADHRIEGTKKWDSRNSLELISFSDSQGYNLTWQLGYGKLKFKKGVKAITK